MNTFTMLLATVNAGYVQRYHADVVHDHQTVGAHTFGALALLDFITEGKASRNQMRALLLHDVAEISTGDTPYHSKKEFPALKAALDAAEKEVWNKLGEPCIQLTPSEKVECKFCDLAEAGFHAMREVKMGNTHAVPILEKVVKGLVLPTLPRSVHDRSWLIHNQLEESLNG